MQREPTSITCLKSLFRLVANPGFKTKPFRLQSSWSFNYSYLPNSWSKNLVITLGTTLRSFSIYRFIINMDIRYMSHKHGCLLLIIRHFVYFIFNLFNNPLYQVTFCVKKPSIRGRGWYVSPQHTSECQHTYPNPPLSSQMALSSPALACFSCQQQTKRSNSVVLKYCILNRFHF